MRAGTDIAASAERRDAPSKGAQTRRAVLDAAIARFGREGYRATSVADIARDASVGGTVTYAYFPNKEALFLAAVDEDAAAVIGEGVSSAIADAYVKDWRQKLFFSLIDSLDRHPLARRLLAGLEPEVTDRVLEIPALAELRKACAERLRVEQRNGVVRDDIDPLPIANGIVAIMLSLLMSVVQLGPAATTYGDDVAAVFAAAIERAPAGRA
jgi:AcrR family transcriptional regulator